MDELTRQLVLLVNQYGPDDLALSQIKGTVNSLKRLILEPRRWHLEDLAQKESPAQGK